MPSPPVTPVSLAALALDADAFRLLVAGCFVLAYVHAYRKLSPYFAATWFGAGLVFGYFWAGRSTQLEPCALPALVFYVAAAATKGLVESRPRWQGNHPVHVIVTGLFSALVALPLLASAATLGVTADAGPDASLPFLAGLDARWLGGIDPERAGLWAIAGFVFYGAYKVLDHVGLGRVLQTLLLFGCAPLLVRAVGWIAGG